MGKNSRNFQTNLEPLRGDESRYISLAGLGIQFRKSENELRHWIGYSQKTFEPMEVGKRKLIDYILEAMSGTYAKPERVEIPEQVSGLYHIGGFYFKIFEEEWGYHPGFCGCVSDRRLSGRLLYSESWNDIIGAIEKRDLVEELAEARERRDKRRKETGSFKTNAGDCVRDPKIEKWWREMTDMFNKMRNQKFNPDTIIGVSIRE